MASQGILSLPNELLLDIARVLHYAGEVAAFSATNRQVHSVLGLELARAGAREYPHLLCWACDVGEVDLVARLLRAGADPNEPFVMTDQTWNERDTRAGLLKQFENGARYTGCRVLYDDEAIMPDFHDRASVLQHIYLHPTKACRREKRLRRRMPRRQAVPDDMDSEDDIYELGDSYHPKLSLAYLDRFQDDGSYWFPLHAAASNGHDAVLRLLAGHGAFLDAPSSLFCRCALSENEDRRPQYPRRPPTSFLRTPLHAALCSRKDGSARQLLVLGSSSKLFLDGDTDSVPQALHFAAARDCLQTVQYIVHRDSPANVDVRDKDNLTPLWHACMGRGVRQDGASQVLSWLIEHGAQVNADLGNGRTILHDCCIRHWYGTAMELVGASANINACWESDRLSTLRPLELSCIGAHLVCLSPKPWPAFWGQKNDESVSGLPEGSETTRFALVKELVRAGADVHPHPYCTLSPLGFAARLPSESSVALLDILVNAGASVNDVDSQGFTPLMRLCSRLPLSIPDEPAVAIAKWLLDHGACPNVLHPSKGTALHLVTEMSSEENRKDLSKLLLEHGVDPQVVDVHGRTAFTLHANINDFEICRTLITHGARPTPSHLRDRFSDLLHDFSRDLCSLSDRPWSYCLGDQRPESASKPNHSRYSSMAATFERRLRGLLSVDDDGTIAADPSNLDLALEVASFPAAKILLEVRATDQPWILEHGPDYLRNLVICPTHHADHEGRLCDYRRDLASCLINMGTDVNKGALVQHALDCGELEFATFLVSRGANRACLPRPEHLETRTSLHAALCSNSPEDIKTILSVLQKPYDPDVLNEHLLAVCQEHFPGAMPTDIWIKVGANVNATNANGETPLSLVLARASDESKRPISIQTTQDAINVVDMIQVLLDSGARQREANGKDHREALRSLMFPRIKARDYYHNTAHLAKELRRRCVLKDFSEDLRILSCGFMSINQYYRESDSESDGGGLHEQSDGEELHDEELSSEESDGGGFDEQSDGEELHDEELSSEESDDGE